MARPDTYEEQFRRLRKLWGLILAAVWIIYWWYSNSRDENAALGALQPAHGLWQSWVSQPVKEGGIRGTFVWHMLFAVVTSPLALVVSNYLARWHIDSRKKSDTVAATKEQHRQIEQQTADLNRIRQSAAIESTRSHAANERHEIITRIGDVDSQLLIYEAERDQERRTRTLLNLTQFVYELHAKFPPERLCQSLKAEPALQGMIAKTLQHMQTLGLQDRNFYSVLESFNSQRESI